MDDLGTFRCIRYMISRTRCFGQLGIASMGSSLHNNLVSPTTQNLTACYRGPFTKVVLGLVLLWYVRGIEGICPKP